MIAAAPGEPLPSHPWWKVALRRCRCAAVPNAIGALPLHLQQRTGRTPDACFGWTEGSPLAYVLRYVFLGEGDTAPMTREVLRRAIREPRQRPRVHVS